MWQFLHRWHRRLGILSALFVILLVITGIMLNHTGALQLQKHFVQNRLLLNLYNIQPAKTPHGFQAGNHWVSQVGERIYLDETEITGNVDTLHGAVLLDGLVVAGFDGQLLLLTPDARVVERLAGAQGVPAGMQALGVSADNRQLVIRASHGDYRVNLDTLDWHEQDEIEADWSVTRSVPEEKRAVLMQLYRGKGLTLERLILDLHSGRLLGERGVYLIDMAAVLFLLLAVSGTWMWLKR